MQLINQHRTLAKQNRNQPIPSLESATPLDHARSLKVSYQRTFSCFPKSKAHTTRVPSWAPLTISLPRHILPIRKRELLFPYFNPKKASLNIARPVKSLHVGSRPHSQPQIEA